MDPATPRPDDTRHLGPPHALGTPQPLGPTQHLGTTLSRRAAIDAATRVYLAGQPLDMSALADELGVGRSTLYRWVGNREDLLATVLAEAAERTYRKVLAESPPGDGVEHALTVLTRFMYAVVGAVPMQAFSTREPLLFIRLVMLPGPVESTASRLVAELLETEVTAGRLVLSLPPAVLGQVIVRLCDAHMYAHLLGREAPEIDVAVELVATLLGADRSVGAAQDTNGHGHGI